MVYVLAFMIFEGQFIVKELKVVFDEMLEGLNFGLFDYGKYNGIGYYICDYIMDYVEMEANEMIGIENERFFSLEEEGEVLWEEVCFFLMWLYKDYVVVLFWFYEDILFQIILFEKVEEVC